MNAIIFGANGQDGFYLNKLLEAQGIDVIGVSRSGNWLKGDVGDYKFVTELIKSSEPDYIFHFAANSTTAHSVWQENHSTICDGTLFILESAKNHCREARIFISGSGLQFENNGRPIKETDPFAATSHYAVSRIHSAYAARYYRSLGLKTYLGYFFNHESPLRTERHMSRKIAEFAKRSVFNHPERLEVGDISVEKEWTFAGDVVDAVWRLVNQDTIVEATIGSGLGFSIADWLDACFNIIHQDWRQKIIPIEGFKAEYNSLLSNPESIHSIGWRPKVNFEQLAELMMQ